MVKRWPMRCIELWNENCLSEKHALESKIKLFFLCFDVVFAGFSVTFSLFCYLTEVFILLSSESETVIILMWRFCSFFLSFFVCLLSYSLYDKSLVDDEEFIWHSNQVLKFPFWAHGLCNIEHFQFGIRYSVFECAMYYWLGFQCVAKAT